MRLTKIEGNLHVWVAKKMTTMHELENVKLLCHVIQSQTIIHFGPKRWVKIKREQIVLIRIAFGA